MRGQRRAHMTRMHIHAHVPGHRRAHTCTCARRWRRSAGIAGGTRRGASLPRARTRLTAPRTTPSRRSTSSSASTATARCPSPTRPTARSSLTSCCLRSTTRASTAPRCGGAQACPCAAPNMCVCVCVCLSVYIFLYTYIYIHTHKHTHRHVPAALRRAPARGRAQALVVVGQGLLGDVFTYTHVMGDVFTYPHAM